MKDIWETWSYSTRKNTATARATTSRRCPFCSVRHSTCNFFTLSYSPIATRREDRFSSRLPPATLQTRVTLCAGSFTLFPFFARPAPVALGKIASHAAVAYNSRGGSGGRASLLHLAGRSSTRAFPLACHHCAGAGAARQKGSGTSHLTPLTPHTSHLFLYPFNAPFRLRTLSNLSSIVCSLSILVPSLTVVETRGTPSACKAS